MDKDTKEAIEIIEDTLGAIELLSPMRLSNYINANRRKLHEIITRDKEN